MSHIGSQITPIVCFDWGNTLVHGSPHQPFPNAANTLAELHQRGYKIGIISNQLPNKTIASMMEDITNVGLANYIDFITISSEISDNRGKPHREIFDLALQKTGHWRSFFTSKCCKETLTKRTSSTSLTLFIPICANSLGVVFVLSQ